VRWAAYAARRALGEALRAAPQRLRGDRGLCAEIPTWESAGTFEVGEFKLVFANLMLEQLGGRKGWVRARLIASPSSRRSRIKEVYDDVQEFRKQLAHLAIDCRSKPPMERHCNGKVATPEEGTQIFLSFSDPGRISMKSKVYRPRVRSMRAISLYLQPGKQWTRIPRIPKNAFNYSIFDALTMDAVSKSWVKRTEQQPQKYGKFPSDKVHDWSPPPITWHLGPFIALIIRCNV